MAADTSKATNRPDPQSLTLVVYPHPVLKRRAEEVTVFDRWLEDVVAKMKVMMAEEDGVGLAAPQVGLSLRLFVWSEDGTAENAQVYINPEFSHEEGAEEGEEGCLSLPDIHVKVVRFTKLHVDAVDQFGKPISVDLTDYQARIVQHENDHLEGILLLDRMSPISKLSNRKKIKALEEAKA